MSNFMTMLNSGLVVCLLCIYSVFPSVFSNHFLGGSIMVRPQPGGTRSEIQISYHISWKPRKPTDEFYCDSNKVANYEVKAGDDSIDCLYGCQNTVRITGMPYTCAGYSREHNWSYGEHNLTYNFSVSDVNQITIGTTGCCWVVSGNTNWNISTTFSLVPRNDTGKINSSPRVMGFPYLQIPDGSYNYTISLAVTDPDDDRVQCRWAVGTECLSICSSSSRLFLDPDTCTIMFPGNSYSPLSAVGVAVVVEDFWSGSSQPLSSVSHQFVVYVATASRLCSIPPQFIAPTLPNGACITISAGTFFTLQMGATSRCSGVGIRTIQIIGPSGTIRGPLQQVSHNYYTNVTWMPRADQQNKTHFLCYVVINGFGYTSEQSCIKLVVGYRQPLTPLLETATPNHQLVYPSNNTLQIMFDRKIERPSTSAFIRFYQPVGGLEVYQIDASSSSEVTYLQSNLTIVPNFTFIEGSSYYVNFDEGVAQTDRGCRSTNSKPILNSTFWTFEAALTSVFKSSVNVKVHGSQTVGQPLILQCSVTTIRGINSRYRVDFVWISNGTVLERVEGVTGESSTDNLAVYRDYYTIPQLSITDNNSSYTCEVIINRSPLTSLSATGNFTLNVTDDQPCTVPPRFVNPTSPQRECIIIPPGTRFVQQIMATSSCSNVTSIQVSAPDGTSVGELQHVQGTNDYYINVTWMPTADQQNTTELLCFVAVNVAGLSSELFCMEIAAGYLPPAPSLYHQVVYPSHNTLHVMFDKTIQRPSTSAFIRFYELGEEVYQIDVSSSSEVMFTEASLTIVPNYNFNEGSTYYINFDQGVVQTVYPEGCLLVNEPMLSSTSWTLEVVSFESVFTSSVSVTALSSQRVGQPLILQCSVTTIRDINSRVDFVWISNGRELERAEGVTGESSANDLAVYTDYYIIPQLSTTDDNNLYICKVIVNTVQLVSAAGDITLDLNMQETEEMDNVCNDDDGGFGFMIMFAASAVVNLLLVAAVTILICLLMRRKKNKDKQTDKQTDPNHKAKHELNITASETIYDLPDLTSKVEQGKDSVTNYGYALLSQQEAKSQKQDRKSDDSKVKMEENPAYQCAVNHTNL